MAGCLKLQPLACITPPGLALMRGMLGDISRLGMHFQPTNLVCAYKEEVKGGLACKQGL
jgi:hypothetical protein